MIMTAFYIILARTYNDADFWKLFAFGGITFTDIDPYIRFATFAIFCVVSYYNIRKNRKDLKGK